MLESVTFTAYDLKVKVLKFMMPKPLVDIIYPFIFLLCFL